MTDVLMPRLSDTMTEGSIGQWLKSENDEVRRGDVLAEIETDKAVMDLESYSDGVLQKILVPPGQVVPIGEPIAVIADAGADDGSPAAPSATAAAAAPAAPATAAAPTPAAPTLAASGAVPASGGSAGAAPEAVRLKASPVVRSLARTHDIDLSTVTGTGPGGRIIRVDVDRLIADSAASTKITEPVGTAGPVPAGPAATAGAVPVAAAQVGAVGDDDEQLPLSNIRRITARRLTEAFAVPQFYLTTLVDAGPLTDFRAQINAGLGADGVKISVTDLLIRACAVTLRAHPEVNSSFGEDSIIRHHRVHVGVAVALPDGLIVPVVRDPDRKSVSQISTEAKDLATRARDGRLKPDEFAGGTFTISNLGMFGIDNFTAVLNPPEAAILAVGATTEQTAVADGEIVVRKVMKLTLTVDHRVLDGATGATFLADLTSLLQNPLRIVV
ncbi:dihydrolipoamide acetyltransferase family protein [Nakamurella lactea]|uniref:dihydrolipoamide acetyltransferase family protein n=1 Tax=Nakamurella lactea TaxID=459515 RepID=UPI00040B31E0|nr:dihydrolipoamide acetyltransferase family protein [Nakamurella lactea]